MGTSKASILLSLILGLLLGAVLLVFTAYLSGFLEWETDPSDKNMSLTQGTDWLQNYRCSLGETKELFIRGVEDNYSPTGKEFVPDSELVQKIRERSGKEDVLRHYDDPEPDKFLVENFQIPANFSHGIFVVRLRELSKIKSDTISLGSNQLYNFEDSASIRIIDMPGSEFWEHRGDVFRADLKDLNIPNPSFKETKASIADYINSTKTPHRKLSVKIADDTQVDFMGFALCIGPKENMGMLFSSIDQSIHAKHPTVKQSELLEGYLMAHHPIINGKSCSPYTGCYLCEKFAPLACFEYQNLPVPPDAKDNLALAWSGGEIKFTDPVRGDQFATMDDVHKFCRQSFGETWRGLSLHEGSSMAYILAKHEGKSSPPASWINVKGQKHTNCWAPRPEPAP